MKKITIITGSTLGGTEYVAEHVADILANEGINCDLINQAQVSDLLNTDRLLLITATHGAGDYPESLSTLIKEIEDQNPRLDHLKFSVLAIGDSSYDTFCAAGHSADKLLENLGAQRILTCFEIDILQHPLPEDAAEAWVITNKLTLCG